MPKSPVQRTRRSFLKTKPPDPSPPGKRVCQKEGKRGRKRKLPLSPQAPLPCPGEPLAVPISPISSHSPSTPLVSSGKGKTNCETSPLLPYQLRSSKKRKKLLINPSSPSSMDLLESEQGEFDPRDIPTSDEADALLRDDDPLLSDAGMPTDNLMEFNDVQAVSPDSSPTAAIRSAIEAQTSEGLHSDIFQIDAMPIVNKSNVISNALSDAISDAISNTTTPIPPPSSKPLPKPLPLFPNGLPFAMSKQSSSNQSVKNIPKSSKAPQGNPHQDATYAAKAKTPPKARVLVDNILYVYKSLVAKRPLGANEWHLIDAALMGAMAAQDPNTDPIRIANSGYDAAHRCGFIACRDLASANWCKRAIHDMGTQNLIFRAWAKGEQPETRICRLFFPTRFDRIGEDALIPLLVKHNPPFRSGSLILKNVEEIQNGRAAFIEFDLVAYAHVRAVKHKVEFMMQDIDCQVYIPKRPAQGPGVLGITKLPPTQPPPVSESPAIPTSQTVTLPKASTQAASSSDPRLNKKTVPPLSLAKAPTPATLEEHKKRTRHESNPATDGAKKVHYLSDK